MRNTYRPVGLLSVLLVVLLTGANTAVAQSTLFNIPSTDVVPQGRTYLEFDLVSHPERHENGGFQSYVPRAVFGVRRGVEAGVNVTFTDALAPGQPVEVQPNVKWQFFGNEDGGVSAAAGAVLYVPVKNRAGADTFAMFYAVVSKKVRGGYGPRLIGGAYTLAGRAGGGGSTGGAIAAYEQPLGGRVSFVVDWLGGRNRFGYVTPGLSVAVSKRSLLNVGYSVGNSGRKNNALFAYYGMTF